MDTTTSFDRAHRRSPLFRDLPTSLIVVRPPEIIEDLMGKKPELRFRFIQENASPVAELDV